MSFSANIFRKLLAARFWDQGGIIIEAALLFPLFLLGVFFFLWIGVTLNDNSALASATKRAVRLAATRGTLQTAHHQSTHQIEDIENWINNHSQPSERMIQLLSRGVDWQRAQQHYQTTTTYVFGNSPLEDLPSSYTYALVYFNEAVKSSIGSSVRFPCDPQDKDGTDPLHGYGCISCIFLNPDDLSTTNPSNRAPDDEIGMECQMQPAPFLLAPVMALLRLVTGEQSPSMTLLTKRGFFKATST